MLKILKNRRDGSFCVVYVRARTLVIEAKLLKTA